MYLVELRPGKEELYRTGDELAAAIRSGEVDMHSRIYHRATSKWISVTLHPQYKAISTDRPVPPPPPLPPLERSTWTFFNDSADSLAGANDPAPPTGEATDPNAGDPNWRRPLALSVTGVLLILGLQLSASGPRPPWAARDAEAARAAQARTAAAAMVSEVTAASATLPRSSATVSLASSGDRWPTNDHYAPEVDAPLPAAVPSAAPTAAVLPAAPRLGPKALLSAVRAPARTDATTGTSGANTLLRRWTAAHDSVRARLESGMRVARLNQLFAIGRLTPTGGVTETRMSLAGLSNFVRVYRQQQVAIDHAYQDTFAVVSKAPGWSPAAVRDWYAKSARQDPAPVAALTATLLGQIDSLFGVLDAQAGAYIFTRNTIRFEDAGAGAAYAALRARIIAGVDSAKAGGAADRPGPMMYLIQAIGTTRLPLAS